jgi:L-ribulose-5-phosphate 3-epimerase
MLVLTEVNTHENGTMFTMDSNRRDFLRTGTLAAAASAVTKVNAAPGAGNKPKLGIIAGVSGKTTPDQALARVKRLGFANCQLSVGRSQPELAAPIRAAIDKYGIEVTALMSLGEGKMIWTLRDGETTIGIIPEKTRAERVAVLKRTSDLAKQCGVKAIHTHCGFIPEDPNEPSYRDAVAVIKDVANHVQENGQVFLMETGQETPITLLRAIQDVGLDSPAVNLDVANLILYGRGEPVGALDVLGKHVKGMHAKDGLYPTDPYGLGKETSIGKGRVRFPDVIAGLHALGYSGPITIEREISGPRQEIDIAESRQFLQALIDKTWAS